MDRRMANAGPMRTSDRLEGLTPNPALNRTGRWAASTWRASRGPPVSLNL